MTHPTAGWSRPRASDEAGVSPVIGSVLILVIMTLAIAGILAWGVPAMQALQEQAEYQNTLAQFQQIQSDVRTLRDPQNTRLVTLSVAGGSVTLDRGDRWVISASREAGYDAFFLQGWETGAPGSLTVAGITIDASNQVSVDKVLGGTFTSTYACSGTCTNTVSLGTADLTKDVVRIQIKEGTVRAEAWVFNAGKVTYRQSASHDRNILHLEMGAVFTESNGAIYVNNAPAIKDPDYTLDPKDENLFVRVLQLTGDPASQAGKGRHPLVFHLVDNYGPARGRPSFDPATAVRVQIHGTLEAAFCGYFDARTGWTSVDNAGAATPCPDGGTAGNVNVRYDPGAERLVFDLNHAEVSTLLRAVQA